MSEEDLKGLRNSLEGKEWCNELKGKREVDGNLEEAEG